MIKNRPIILLLTILYLSALFIRPIGEGIHIIEHLITESTFYFHHHHDHDHSDHHHHYSEVLAKVFNQSQKDPIIPISENDFKLNPHNLPISEIYYLAIKLLIQINTPYLIFYAQNIDIPDTPPPRIW